MHAEGEEGEGEGDGDEHLLNKMADQWMSTRDLMKVCTCIHTVLAPKNVSSCDTCCVTFVCWCLYFCVMLECMYVVCMRVCVLACNASMSYIVCLFKRSYLSDQMCH